MKKKFQKICKKLIKASIPIYGLAASLCIFVANCSPNLCGLWWAYEPDTPKSLKDSL